MTTHTDATDKVWKAIYRERHRDLLLKWVSIGAWMLTLLLVTLLVAIGAVSAVEMARAAMQGAVPWMTVLGTVLPVIVPLAGLAVLVALISTIALFLRMRSASLHEIQLRLAALEDALTRDGGRTAES